MSRWPIAIVSGLLNSKKLLSCTFGENLERPQNAGSAFCGLEASFMYASFAHLFLLMV
jgi:hypothetical protein